MSKLIRKHKLSSSINHQRTQVTISSEHLKGPVSYCSGSTHVSSPSPSAGKASDSGSDSECPGPSDCVRSEASGHSHQMSCGCVAPTLSQAHTLAMYRAVIRLIISRNMKVALQEQQNYDTLKHRYVFLFTFLFEARFWPSSPGQLPFPFKRFGQFGLRMFSPSSWHDGHVMSVRPILPTACGEESIIICDNPYPVMMEGISIELSSLTSDQPR